MAVNTADVSGRSSYESPRRFGAQCMELQVDAKRKASEAGGNTPTAGATPGS